MSVSELTVGQRLCARWIGASRMDGEDSTVELRSTVGHGQGAGARLRQAKRSCDALGLPGLDLPKFRP